MIPGIVAQQAPSPAPNVGSYATISPNYRNVKVVLSNGNKTASATEGSYMVFGPGNAKLSGKYYYEVTITKFGTTPSDIIVGMGTWEARLDNYIGSTNRSIGRTNDGRVLYNNLNQAVLDSFTEGDIIGVAIDCDARTIKFRKNGGSWSSVYSPNLGGQPLMPLIQLRYNGDEVTANFGTDPWHTAPDTGYDGWTTDDPVAARYWRYQKVYGPVTVGLAHVVEWELRETVGGTNVIGGGTISADTYFDASTTPDKAIDGNTATYWSTMWNSTPPHWLKYDFGDGNDKLILESTIQTRANTSEGQPQDIRILYSHDNSIFYPANGSGGIAWAPGDNKAFACF